MLITHARRIRIWLATLVAAAYAFGVLGPALAFSVERNVSIVHSLNEAHGGAIILHVHHDDTDHETPGKRGPHIGHQCCGIFALAGLSISYAVFSIFDVPLALVMTEPSDQQALMRPSRLERPPRTNL